MRQIVMSEDDDQHGRNWRPELYENLILKQGQRRPLHFSAIFDILLEKRILRPGFTFRCGNCRKDDWYHVSEFAEEYICRYCFETQRVHFPSNREWQYKSDGLFRIPDSAQGSVAVILSLWRLDHLDSGQSGGYITSFLLRRDDTKQECEIDYAYIVMGTFDSSYELVIGQATRFGDFTDDDMSKMAAVADNLATRPYLAFSTLRDEFSDADKKRLLDLRAAGYNVIAMTREELDPYDLYDRFDNAPHKYAISLGEFAENTVHLNLQIGPKSESTDTGADEG